MKIFKKKKPSKKEPVDPFEEMSKMINDMMKKVMNSDFFDDDFFEKIDTEKPMVYGFSLKMDPEGKVKIDRFGNIEPEKKEVVVKKEREPLVDVMNKEKEITIIAELPGVSKKDINVSLKERGSVLVISVPKKFYKEINLPEKVKIQKTNYKNGVLEITLKKGYKRGYKKK